MEPIPFHPAVTRWFTRVFGEPTAVQRLTWPAAMSGRHTLIAAPTGSGKTLAAFLAAIDTLVREGLECGLGDETRVLYVSPLKALSNDIQKNLEQPLAGIRDALLESGLPDVPIRAWVRTGDTPQGERERMRRTPPHILVTTPESLFILLTSESGRAMLATVRTVIVDEIHALAGNKRGAHLALSLERLSALCERPPVRIGLSATQKPIERMAEFLTGEAADACNIIDTGHVRQRDLAIELPGSPLEGIMAAEVWEEIYDRLAELIRAHRTTLIFVNTRRLAERAARHLGERLGEEAVTAHHGSLAREHRLDAEQRLKGGRLRALVATASLELGIDIGDIDLVCQLGSPRSIATLLQRVGRSGHAVGGLPKGRLFPLSRDDLAECAALLDAVRRDELDRIHIPQAPLDVLAQHLVAEVASREWEEAALYEQVRRAQPYHALTRADYTAVVRMLADGYTTRRGRRGAYLHRDVVNGRLRARPGARLTAVTNAGAIPDQFDYDVILQPQGHFIGTLNEDFAFESLPGDIFQLGSTSYRMLKIEQGKVHAEDAKGQPPNIPFWFGEAPGRTDELSLAVSRLRATLEEKIVAGIDPARQWLTGILKLEPAAAQQLIDYLAAAYAAFGALPTQQQVILERFFDETGDMHLVIHAPFGSRINRAWGLALRKRFCRKFNFELQAAATEDSIVLSLGPTHSFPLDEVASYLRAHNVRDILIQALLAAPMFGTRWRWVANTALAVPRNRNGKRVPAPFQRADAEDLIALVFPDQLACVENIAGDREVPDHPLVAQTLYDCLHDLMDIDGLEQVLRSIESGDIRVLARDLTAPSPLAAEILTARPYAFLDDAPAEERRTLAVQQRRFMAPADAADLGRLDPAAIERVRSEAWPEAAIPDELHDGLVLLGFLREAETVQEPAWPALFAHLTEERRATRVTGNDGAVRWVAAERLAEVLALHPAATLAPVITPVIEPGQELPTPEQTRLSLLRSRLEGSGPITASTLSQHLGLAEPEIRGALAELEQQGFVLQGHFSAETTEVEWCERRLLARIHRYTLKQLRNEIEAVAPADFMRFLFRWQRLDDPGEGNEALAAVLTQLEGYAAPAAAWETHILPARVKEYAQDDLDRLCNSGRFAWFRPLVTRQAQKEGKSGGSTLRTTPITLARRSGLPVWRYVQTAAETPEIELSAFARVLAGVFAHSPAAFFDELQEQSGLLHTQLEAALTELVAAGLVNTDSFAGLRALLMPQHLRPGYHSARRRRRAHAPGVEHAGRWAWLRPPRPQSTAPADTIEQVAHALLRRYGVVFRRLLVRETGLPPWRDLIYIYRRLEARGEIRGGRFVESFSGEQYALPEAVATLRETRRQPADGKLISLSGADPLNLTGIITPGERVATQAGNRVLYRDGIPVAISLGGKAHYFGKIKEGAEQELRDLLLQPRNYAR